MDGAGPSSWPILGTTTPRGYQNPEKNIKNIEFEKVARFLFQRCSKSLRADIRLSGGLPDHP